MHSMNSRKSDNINYARSCSDAIKLVVAFLVLFFRNDQTKLSDFACSDRRHLMETLTAVCMSKGL